MAAVLNPFALQNEAPPRKRFTRREFDRLLDLGAFEGQRYELIDGDLIDKMGQNPPHAYSLARLLRCLVRMFGVDRVRCQSPIEVAEQDSAFSYPEPDLLVVGSNYEDTAASHPSGNELTLLVEVSDTTSRFDQTVKAKLYARAGVPEYWVLDVNSRVLYLHRRPLNGRYSQVINASGSEIVSPEAMPESVVAVSDLLPAA